MKLMQYCLWKLFFFIYPLLILPVYTYWTFMEYALFLKGDKDKAINYRLKMYMYSPKRVKRTLAGSRQAIEMLDSIIYNHTIGDPEVTYTVRILDNIFNDYYIYKTYREALKGRDAAELAMIPLSKDTLKPKTFSLLNDSESLFYLSLNSKLEGMGLEPLDTKGLGFKLSDKL